MPAYCQRAASIEAIRRSSVHRSIATPSSRAAMERARNSILNDPYESLDLLRKIIQEDITKKVGNVMQEFVKDYFGPAVENMKNNLLGMDGQSNADESTYCSNHWLESVCCDALEHAKLAFKNLNTMKPFTDLDNNCKSKTKDESITKIKNENEPIGKNSRFSKRKFEKVSSNENDSSMSLYTGQTVKRKLPKRNGSTGTQQSSSSSITKAAVSNNIDNAGDTILITKQGKPVRREGIKWNPERLNASETQFILGSRANKALGLGGPGRARLYTKHPDLFKYSIKDREDKEWLAKQSGLIAPGSSVGGKACYVMVLQDILELASTDEYVSHPRRKHGELTNAGFYAPSFMVEKMKTLMKQIATDPDVSDEQLLESATSKIQSSTHEDGKVNTKVKLKHDSDSNSHEKSPVNYNQTLQSNKSSSVSSTVDDIKPKPQEVASNENKNSDCQLSQSESNELLLISDQKLENDMTTQENNEHDSLADTGSVEEDDLGSLLHGVNLNSLVREFEMEAACVAAAAAEAVEGECNEGVGDVRGGVCEEEVSNLGGFLALADECGDMTSNSRDGKSHDS